MRKLSDQYMGNYGRSEVKTFRVARVCWNVDARVQFFSSTESPSDERTLLLSHLVVSSYLLFQRQVQGSCANYIKCTKLQSRTSSARTHYKHYAALYKYL